MTQEIRRMPCCGHVVDTELYEQVHNMLLEGKLGNYNPRSLVRYDRGYCPYCEKQILLLQSERAADFFAVGCDYYPMVNDPRLKPHTKHFNSVCLCCGSATLLERLPDVVPQGKDVEMMNSLMMLVQSDSPPANHRFRICCECMSILRVHPGRVSGSPQTSIMFTAFHLPKTDADCGPP